MHLSEVMLLSLCLAASLVASRSIPTSNISWVPCSENVPDSTNTFNGSTIDLTTLPSTLQCGRLDVPMDYAKPMCETNQITLGVAVFRSEKSKGPLFFNPGGTDPGVVVAWEVALNISNAFTGLEDFDLVVMDVRGTFSSNPLNVSLDLFAPLMGSYPTNQQEYNEMKAVSKVVFQSWIDLSSPPGIIQHVGTREVVQDYESVRKALGYESINFLGASYGGFRAGQYAATFPERVGRFVLDSAGPHGRSLFDQAQDSMAMTSRMMLRADAYCLNDTTCPFYGQGKGAISKVFQEILATAEKTPYYVSACEAEGLGCYPNVTALDIRQAMQGALAGAPDFPGILTGLADAALKGDASAFISGPPPFDAVVAMPLLANDYEFEKSFSAFQYSLTQGLKSDTSQIGLSNTWQIQLWSSGWPYSTPANKPLPQLKEKMLIVTADFDGSAPTEWGTFTWKQLPKSVLVVRHGDDHVSFPLVDQLSTKMTKEFLNTGVLPSAQSNAEVTVYTPGMTRAPISDPYEVPTGPAAGDIDSGITVEIPF